MSGGANLYVYRICLVATLGGLLFGYDTAVISGANNALQAHFHLSDIYLGWVVGSALLGCCGGVLVAGKLTDLIGRRAVLALSAALFLISALLCAITVTPTELVCARILGGIGVGMASLLSPLYIAELSPTRIRGALVSLNQIAILVGMVLSYLVNAWIAQWGVNHYTNFEVQYVPGHYAGQPDVPEIDPVQFWLQTMSWRYMLGAMAIPAAIFLLLTFGIPESPRWLLKRDRIDDARGVLKRINGDNAVVEAEMRDIRAAIAHEQGKLSELFRPNTRGTVFMAMVLALFQAITGINIVMYYAPTIFTSAGMGTVAALSTTVIIPVVMIAFTIGSMFLVDRAGRKPILLFASAGMGISLALLGYTFAHQANVGTGLLVWILTYVASFSIGMGGIYWVVVTEIFPTRVRGAASSLSVVFLWGGNFIVSLYFPVMLAQMKGAAFFVFAAMCALCFVFIWLCVPETKGKSLEQIEHELFKV